MPLPFLNRREFLPVLRYGNFAGPGYAGGIGGEDRVNLPTLPRSRNARPASRLALAQTAW